VLDKPRIVILSLLVGALCDVASTQDAPAYENLQVLPADISGEELGRIMVENLRGLGLPRRQSEGCLHCHVGDMERPSDTWDWASDAKPAKLTARTMMRMVDTINRNHLPQLVERLEPPMRVTCTTCHAGRLDPRPLQTVLLATYRADGVDSALAKYRELRELYFGGDAYDFRENVLTRMAFELAAEGALDAAVAFAELNVEANPTLSGARGAWHQLRLARTTMRGGVAEALEQFDALREAESTGHPLLDGLGWWLYRAEAIDDALTIFRRNLALYPDVYIPNESLADALWFHDERDDAILMFEMWLERHPDHAMARRRLDTLRHQMQAATEVR
jgi:tetratricopeptide (TPR) repeat protein